MHSLQDSRQRAAIHVGIRLHLVVMVMNALVGAVFLIADYPAERVLPLVLLPSLLAAMEGVLVRRVRFELLDRVYALLGALNFFVIGALAALTGGLRSPFVPFVFVSALIPLILFGDLRHVIARHLAVVLIVLVLGYLPDSVLGPALSKEAQALITAIVAGSMMSVVTYRARRFIHAAKLGIIELDRMREERLAEASDRLVRMQSVSSRIAHELKNPLAAIKSLVQLTQKSSSDKDRERLEVVQEEIARMEVILRDYLSFSRPLDDLRVAPIDLADVLVDVRDVLSARAETSGVRLDAALTPTLLRADARRLKEALINLVGNAIEATPSGGRVTLRCEPSLAATGHLPVSAVLERTRPEVGAVITITDTGRGMSPETLDRVGTPFFTTRNDGTGLGVHLARGVVAQHGGTLRYASELGFGTAVTLTLPGSPPDTPTLPSLGAPS